MAIRGSRAIVIAASLMTIGVSDSRASLLFYTSQASFNAAEPGLPVQSFGNANLFGQPYITQASPLDSATNDAVFAAGSILPGLSISTLNPGLVSNALIVEAGSIGNNWFGDTLILNFAPGVQAVGTDVFANTSPQTANLTGNFTETVYSGSTLLGSKNFAGLAMAESFIGVSSTAAITSLDLLYATDDATAFVNTISFGSQTATVPEPSTIALSIAGLIFFGLRVSSRSR